MKTFLTALYGKVLAFPFIPFGLVQPSPALDDGK